MQTITLNDRVPLSGIKRDSAGNLVGVARAARTGIQLYAGYEVGRPDLPQVRVWRPAEEVFNRDSMRSFAGAPVTIEHPAEMVTPENWKDHAVGESASDDIVRDGEVVKVPFIVRDAAGQAAIEDGKHEVSMGYACMLDFTGGTVPAGQNNAGETYDAVQRNMRINHLAIVDKARGGAELRIGDSNSNEGSRKVATKNILVDGLQVEVTDAAEAAINKLTGTITALTDRATKAETELGTATTAIATKDGEIAALKQQLADATNPAALAAAAQARSTLVDTARRIVPNYVADGKDDATIRKEIVHAKLGDAGKALTADAAIEGAFSALAAGAPAAPNGTGNSNALDSAISAPVNIGDAVAARDAARQARLDRLNGRTPSKEGAAA